MKQLTKTIAVVMLHGDCDMRCMFCVTDDEVDLMTPSRYARLLAMLNQRGFNNIVLGGGEPFCWPFGVYSAARAAKDAGMVVQIGTNGVSMPDDDAYADCVDRYVLPIDASDPLIHNWLRPLPSADDGHHALMQRRLEQLRRHKRSVTVSTVISRANLHDLIAIGDYLADYVADGGRLHAWHLYRFIPEGRGGLRNAKQLDISDCEYEDAVQKARAQYYPFTIFKRPNMRHSATVDFFWYQHGELQIGSHYWEKSDSDITCATDSSTCCHTVE